MSDLDEEKLKLLRSFLNRDGVKLWLAPYTTSLTQPAHYPVEMVTKYQQELGESSDAIKSYLDTLRFKAMENIQAREEFRRTGMATFRIKVIASNQKQEYCTLKMLLSSTALQLKEELARKFEFPSISNLKFISLGKVLQDNLTLQDQGLDNQSQLMAIILEDGERNKLLETEKQMEILEKTKEAATILCSKENLLTVADQHGKSLRIPEEEKKALCLALAIYEKGKDFLNEKKYSEAVLFFVESEKQFLGVNSDLFSNVDNYALLCLDVAWCYLMLNNLDQLPDAESRLKKCEDIFNKSYGNNLERLKALKGDATKEQALFTRLYLLKGIVAFHRNELETARFWLTNAHDNLNQLKVDQDKLEEVMSMGYSRPEARLALRRARGNISEAVEHILQEREKMERVQNEEIAMEMQEKLGETIDGSKVDIENYQYLLQMGFKKKESRFVLHFTNNNLEESIQMLVAGNLKHFIVRYQSNLNGASTSGYRPPLERSGASYYSSDSSSEEDDLGIDVEEYRNRLNIPKHAEEHLDLTLEEEENFILKYQTLIGLLLK